MKVQVIGGGGREHALAWKFAQYHQVIAYPGNPGIAQVARCVPAMEQDADLTVVGPEAPLVDGIVDRFRARGQVIFGPTAAAAQLEGSKAFSKQFMMRAGIPTARFTAVASLPEARAALKHFGYPVVLKADGLAAGKGVVIAQTAEEAEHALPALLSGPFLVIEEFLQGDEVSFIVLSDGTRALPLEPTQDHKAAYDGDRGPNTGGMGAYCDSTILTAQQTGVVMDRVILPTIEHMKQDGTPFTGFLYAGLMMTADGPKVLEFNARLGDPETQALMHRMDSDFVPVLAAAARGDLSGASIQWKPDPSVCVVMAAHGYPGNVRTGDAITGIEAAETAGTIVFQAGTRIGPRGLETSGGRVLGVTASGETLGAAIGRAYAGVLKINFDGMHYRRDIGAKGLTRNS
ncbi:MAG TPA: phosphoribosylamine--glycine ligase [Bryobacteraceae bacterium]|nr:phosphoribosylamine--glycine ligase [Bryobacteraceae bacterium]